MKNYVMKYFFVFQDDGGFLNSRTSLNKSVQSTKTEPLLHNSAASLNDKRDKKGQKASVAR